MLMFAGDTKIFGSIQNDTDCIQLQSDINNLLERSRIWQLNFNVSKYYFTPWKSHSYNYNITGNIVSCTDVVKDMGIYMDIRN